MAQNSYISCSSVYKYFSRYDKTFSSEENLFTESGKIFESKIINYISEKYKNDFIYICSPNTRYDMEKIKKLSSVTLNCMCAKIPIIYSAPVYNENDKVYGICDLIVRLDYISKLFENETIINTLNLQNPLSEYYVIIDIKLKTLDILKNNFLSGNKTYDGYKAQVFLYTKSINEMFLSRNIRSPVVNIGFILGKGIKGIHTVTFNPFFKPGTINLNDNDLLTKVKECLDWLRNRRYPNTDFEDESYLDDFLKVYGCGPSLIPSIKESGFKNIYDRGLKAEKIGIKGQNNIDLFNSIIKVNKGRSNYLPKNITDETINTLSSYSNPIFLDFEFFPNGVFNDFEDIKNIKSIDFLFMIGIGYTSNENWMYDCFMCDKLDKNTEMYCLMKLINFVKDKNVDCIYYYDVEKEIFLKKIKEFNIKLDSIWTQEIKWVDVKEVLQKERVVFKGCFDYKLKNIMKALIELGLIKNTIDFETDVKSGMNCMLDMFNFYKSGVEDKEFLFNMLNYNNLDCRYLYEIINFLKCMKYYY